MCILKAPFWRNKNVGAPAELLCGCFNDNNQTDLFVRGGRLQTNVKVFFFFNINQFMIVIFILDIFTTSCTLFVVFLLATSKPFKIKHFEFNNNSVVGVTTLFFCDTRVGIILEGNFILVCPFGLKAKYPCCPPLDMLVISHNQFVFLQLFHFFDNFSWTSVPSTLISEFFNVYVSVETNNQENTLMMG